MAWNNFIYGLGEFIEATFEILPVLGNSFNYLVMAIMTVYFFYWMGQMTKHKKAGES